MSKKAAGVIFYRRDENNEIQILMIERSDYVGIAPAWAIPGGKVEKDESIIKGMVRECEEELGVSFESLASKDSIYFIYSYDMPNLRIELDDWDFCFTIIEANSVGNFPGSLEGRIEWKSLSWILSHMDQLTYPCWMSYALRDLGVRLMRNFHSYYGIDKLKTKEPLILTADQKERIKNLRSNRR